MCDCNKSGHKNKSRSLEEPHKSFPDDKPYDDSSERGPKKHHHNCKKHHGCNRCPILISQDDCIECLSCFQAKCGSLSMSLVKTSSPKFYTFIGEIITYSYVITNTGTIPINLPIEIKDNKLGTQVIAYPSILPGMSQTFTRTHPITANDLQVESITNTASAAIRIDRKRSLCSNTSSVTITQGFADLSGTISQTIPDLGPISVVVTINNSGNSLTPASGVNLFLPYPIGITGGNITLGSNTPPASNPEITDKGINISELSIPISGTFQYDFSYTPTVAGAYTWGGTIISRSYDPNLNNNDIISTVIYRFVPSQK